MKPELQIKALAELDGYQCLHAINADSWAVFSDDRVTEWFESMGEAWADFERFKSYLTSYDAIIPLIQKQPEKVKDILWNDYLWNQTDKVCAYDFSPAQLCEALLRATGEWKD